MHPYGLSNGQTAPIWDEIRTEPIYVYNPDAIDGTGVAEFTGYDLSRAASDFEVNKTLIKL